MQTKTKQQAQTNQQQHSTTKHNDYNKKKGRMFTQKTAHAQNNTYNSKGKQKQNTTHEHKQTQTIYLF